LSGDLVHGDHLQIHMVGVDTAPNLILRRNNSVHFHYMHHLVQNVQFGLGQNHNFWLSASLTQYVQFRTVQIIIFGNVANLELVCLTDELCSHCAYVPYTRYWHWLMCAIHQFARTNINAEWVSTDSAWNPAKYSFMYCIYCIWLV
jgi:hypothetical protein